MSVIVAVVRRTVRTYVEMTNVTANMKRLLISPVLYTGAWSGSKSSGPTT